MSTENGEPIFGAARSLSTNLVSKLIALIGRRLPLSYEQACEIETTLNEMGPKKVQSIHNWGTLCTLPIVAVMGVIFGWPFMFPEQTMFAGWDSIAISMPNWTWFLGILPMFMLAGISGSAVAIAFTRGLHRIRWPSQSTRYLNYLGEATSHGKDGFKVEVDYVSFSRIIFVISLALYAITLGVYYLSSDIVTQTHYHKRSILPFLNQAVDHDDLVYVYNTSEKRGGDLQLLWEKDDTLFLNRYLQGNGEAQANRIVKAIAEIPTVEMAYIDGG